jgi:broad specificity phosphatase PhoE
MFDVIPSDRRMQEWTDNNMDAQIQKGVRRLRDLLKPKEIEFLASSCLSPV